MYTYKTNRTLYVTNRLSRQGDWMIECNIDIKCMFDKIQLYIQLLKPFICYVTCVIYRAWSIYRLANEYHPIWAFHRQSCFSIYVWRYENFKYIYNGITISMIVFCAIMQERDKWNRTMMLSHWNCTAVIIHEQPVFSLIVGELWAVFQDSFAPVFKH